MDTKAFPINDEGLKTDITNLQPDEASDDQKLSNKRWVFRILALFCAVFFSAGSHYANQSISSLKPLIKEGQGLDNTQYGAAQSAVYLINTLMPLLGGVFMDRFGTAYGSVISSSLILFGNILIAISANIKSFSLLIVGRIFHGLGSGVIVVAQETILGKWFSTSVMATVIGIQIGSSRLFSFLAQGTASSVAKSTDFYGNALWLSVGICFLSWVATIVYAFVLSRSGGEVISESTKKSSFSPKRLLYLPPQFWVMPFTIFFLGGVWTPFLGSVSEFVLKKYGTSELGKQMTLESAAWRSSVSLLLPVILSPLTGGFIDGLGYRSVFVVLSSILTILAIGLLAWSSVTVYVGLTIFSLALTIGPVALTSSVPLLLPADLIGTGIGAHKSGLSIGIALVHLILGHVQDVTPDKGYSGVMILLMAVSCISLISALAYVYITRVSFGGLFDVPVSKRAELIKSLGTKLPCNMKTLDLNTKSISSIVLTSIMGILVLISWIIFIWSLIENPLSYFQRFKF